MKILFIAHRTPWPPMKGFQVRPYQMMKALKEAGHQVDFMSFAHSEEDLKGAAPLRNICHTVRLEPTTLFGKILHSAMALALGKPFSLGYFFTSSFQKAVRSYLADENPDAVIVYSSSMAQFIPRDWRRHGYMEMADIDSAKWAEYAERGSWPQKWLYALEAKRLFKVEQQIVQDFGCISLAAERELRAWRKLNSAQNNSKVMVITNGTELDAFLPMERDMIDIPSLPQSEQHWFEDKSGPVMVFTGAMDYEPNVEAVSFFAHQVLPSVRQSHPSARFLIVGAKPTEAVKALGQLPGVGVTGFVDKVQPYLALASVYVVPLMLARGVQNKVIEAMACAVPIVTTTAAHEGIAATPGENYLLADTAEAFSGQILSLLAEPEKARALGQSARKFVETNLDWTRLMQRFMTEVEKLARY
jgi:sugar transferase (PEP-CTERM/EpsH1 system associated)